jgi:hypothetical protein
MDSTSSETNIDTELINEFDYDDEEMDGIVVAVSEAVGEVTDTSMEELPPLQESIDCDALETLFKSFDDEARPGIGQVQFPFNGCTIRVDTTGLVQVYSRDGLATDGSGY